MGFDCIHTHGMSLVLVVAAPRRTPKLCSFGYVATTDKVLFATIASNHDTTLSLVGSLPPALSQKIAHPTISSPGFEFLKPLLHLVGARISAHSGRAGVQGPPRRFGA